ncbi:MAG: fibronectin type III-like domain-contianing protein [Verrucomicrobia bacterium]|nr:fibronectin type III-like domain-contianing protein [Verrucomicrobiota bacterium]
MSVSFTVTNTGKVAGAEVAQLYVGEQNAPVPRPLKELKGFQKTQILQPGASQKVTLQLDQRSFAYWNTTIEKWDAPKDTYNVYVGSSSDITDPSTLKGQVMVTQDITANP